MWQFDWCSLLSWSWLSSHPQSALALCSPRSAWSALSLVFWRENENQPSTSLSESQLDRFQTEMSTLVDKWLPQLHCSFTLFISLSPMFPCFPLLYNKGKKCQWKILRVRNVNVTHGPDSKKLFNYLVFVLHKLTISPV